MAARREGKHVIWVRRTTPLQLALWLGWLTLVAVTILAWQVMTRDTIWEFVKDAPRQAADLLSRMVPPNWTYMNRLWWPLSETVNMATLGTLLAVLLAVPVALLAARNTTPSTMLVSCGRSHS